MMEKVMYVPRGHEVTLENLYCENLIVRGSLHVNGQIVAKHIRCTKGYIGANAISAKTLVGYKVDACNIVVDKLIAEQVCAMEIHAVQSMVVSTYVSADLVQTGKATLADSNIGDLQSDGVTYLTAKNRSLIGTLFASFMRTLWFWLSCQDYVEVLESDEEDTDIEPEVIVEDETELESQGYDPLSDDAEFLRIKEMYVKMKEAGYTIQLIPNEPQNETNASKPVNSDYQFTAPVDENAA